ncbi:MAG TPA: protein kinase [Kiritimatiellia bacterium]|nr:protein kinase [Kiritimatiellia bacterium]
MNSIPQLPGYEILGKIGSGGMSTVWKARQLSLDRPVAIKTLAAEFLPDEEALQRFRIEAQAAARLNHPGIVQVYDAGEIGQTPYIVMEYVDGRSVGDMLADRGKLPELAAIKIVESVAFALGYAWDKDCIIHCDIKPDNLLVTRDGSVKVVDLGLARFIGLHRRAADGDTIIGTPNYTAPEQAEGLPDLDCRADIYSLGATLYHMLTGALPFAGSPGSSAMERHIREFIPDPMELNHEISPGAAWLIEKMMVKDRAFRPAYWSLVQQDMAEVRQGRFPKPPLPEPGQSTVARSAKRLSTKPAPAEEAAPREPRMIVKAPPARKKVVMAAAVEPVALARASKESGLGRALFQTLLLVSAAAAVYIFFALDLPKKIGFRVPDVAPLEALVRPDAPASTPAPTPIATPVTPASAPVAPPRVMAAPAAPVTAEDPWWSEADTWDDGGFRSEEAPPSAPAVPAPVAEPRPAQGEPAARNGKVTWQNPDFLRGARAFNEAIELYKNYQKTRENPSDLTRIEALARQAVRAFEGCRHLAPPEVNMDTYIRNAYHLIADVRQSTLVDNAERGR